MGLCHAGEAVSIIGKAIGVTPDGLFHFARPCITLRGTRKRADRIRTLGAEDLERFRLAATTLEGETFWWTEQMIGSPRTSGPYRVLFTFQLLFLVDALELSEWRLVDDGGYLVRLRREPGIWPVGFRMDAAYVLAFDGSDKRL